LKCGVAASLYLSFLKGRRFSSESKIHGTMRIFPPHLELLYHNILLVNLYRISDPVQGTIRIPRDGTARDGNPDMDVSTTPENILRYVPHLHYAILSIVSAPAVCIRTQAD
jgi:hypothetical protein